MTDKGDEPAFPCEDYEGFTKREVLEVVAMVGLLSSSSWRDVTNADSVATIAGDMSDAMLKMWEERG